MSDQERLKFSIASSSSKENEGNTSVSNVAPVRKRLQPSEKQLKQQKAYPVRQKSFSSSNQTIMAGLYDLEETLGKGHFATVKAAKHVFTGERVAVKVIDKTKLDGVSQKALLKEVLCMKLVQHPNVVKLYEVIDTSSKMYLVLELGQGDLYDLILRQQGGLPESSARIYFQQILTAVSYCHKLHVAHRDLKPENVVFFPPTEKNGSSSKSSLGQVKLTDFGFSNKFCPGVNLDTSCGSLAYSAPEILLGDSYDAPAVDIWSLGVILYMLVCGRAPFQEANDSETLIMIMDVKYSIPEHLSHELKDLITIMLVRDVARRATLQQIETHPWVRLGANVARSTVPLITFNTISDIESERICNEMVKGGIVASYDEVKSSLGTNAYNHVTSTYYLLAERMLREKAVLPLAISSPSPPACSPPMIIRRKNSHQFEDVVLPSNLPKEDEKQNVVTHPINLASVDLEFNRSNARKAHSQKFVCMPVMEPEDEESESKSVGSSRNSSPHHPHYYHHLGKRGVKVQDNDTPVAPPSPPLHHRRTRLNKSHHSHSDSSDEGGGVAGGGAAATPPVTIVVSSDNQDNKNTSSGSSGSGASGASTKNKSCSIKPSPSYEPVPTDREAKEASKKKRVLFLSWFFKRTGKANKKNGNGANGIYKTRSCAELKSRGVNTDEHTRDCFAVCNGSHHN
ncbi:unnamed protein product [Orchesella dallaii]|uniref:Protein kinase domain-containing protein n=1 Tax=Orchesella dallaii TaxID=48710 RepID=A0ABP1PL46_9HEXA